MSQSNQAWHQSNCMMLTPSLVKRHVQLQVELNHMLHLHHTSQNTAPGRLIIPALSKVLCCENQPGWSSAAQLWRECYEVRRQSCSSCCSQAGPSKQQQHGPHLLCYSCCCTSWHSCTPTNDISQCIHLNLRCQKCLRPKRCACKSFGRSQVIAFNALDREYRLILLRCT